MKSRCSEIAHIRIPPTPQFPGLTDPSAHYLPKSCLCDVLIQDMGSSMEQSPSAHLTSARDFYMDYEVGQILGDGISSVVRKCTHKETGDDYAVKIIDKLGKNKDLVENDKSSK